MRSVWRRLTIGLGAIANWRYFRPAVFVACLWPASRLGYRLMLVLTGRDPMALGADPTKTMLHATGEAALTILLVTLSVTPVRRIFGINRVQTVRRMLGVWSFSYAAMHICTYLVFDQLCYSLATCQGQAIWQDILKRRFIFAGQLGFVLLLLLAITSTGGWMRRLKQNWSRLHRLAYVAAMAGVVHFIWIQKSDYSRPRNWAAWLAVVLGARIYFAVDRRRRRSVSTVTA